MMHVKVGGETLALLPSRALFWPRAATLFIADPHFGKIDSFQAAGVPIPGGVTDADLARLSACIMATGAAQLVILGDFFHTHASQSAQTLAVLAAWRTQHTSLEIILVPGNHDRHAGAPPPDLNIVCVDEPYELPPFICRHHPPVEPSDADRQTAYGYVLAGHLHPVAVLRDVDGTRHRFPCFHVGRQVAILPAFGAFTGGQAIRPRVDDRVFIIYNDFVREAGGLRNSPFCSPYGGLV
ncbi:MAG: ligase-associated DNA damage response endonuclease PdeM [Caldilinea sp.]